MADESHMLKSPDAQRTRAVVPLLQARLRLCLFVPISIAPPTDPITLLTKPLPPTNRKPPAPSASRARPPSRAPRSSTCSCTPSSPRSSPTGTTSPVRFVHGLVVAFIFVCLSLGVGSDPTELHLSSHNHNGSPVLQRAPGPLRVGRHGRLQRAGAPHAP